jgi:outer membrane protein assembly factor BamD (BamD/ComL family)
MSMMGNGELRISLLLISTAAILGGCATVPPETANAQSRASEATQSRTNSGNDEYDGWLFKSLTGRKTADKPAAANANRTASASSGVQQASATMPASNESSPWVPGPASPSAQGMPAATSGPVLFPNAAEKTIAGPPPSVPAELPAHPAGAVSIGDVKAEEEKKSFEWSDLAPENIYKNAKAAAGYGPNEAIARTALGEGKTLFIEKKYAEAIAKFATAADRWPDSPLEEDALFLKGESEFFADRYPKAHDTYGGLLKKYSNTRYLDTVMARQFALGRYWEQLQDKTPKWPVTPNVTDGSRPLFDTFGYAVQAYERVRLHDPTGPLADDSLMALANAYFRRGQFENAAYNYELLMKEYPNSEFQAKAHVLGLQAKMRVYQGTMYVQGPLDDAKKIADQTLDQFSKDLGPERERVAQARAQIVEEKANREFALAQYYEQKKYYGAARMYYQSVIAEYPSTDRAKQARARLEAIRHEPDSPPNHFSWLTDWFEPPKK